MAHPKADRNTLKAALIGHEAQLGAEDTPREKNHERGSSQAHRGGAEEVLGGIPEIQRQVS